MLTPETIVPAEECADYKCTLLFTHENIAGLTTGSKDITIKSNFSVKDFSRWTYVFNGHIHRPQVVGNIINIGSIMIKTGGGWEQKRFIHFKDGEITSVPIDHPKFYVADYSQLTGEARELILKDSRNYYRFDVDSTQVKDQLFKQWNVSYNITKKKSKRSQDAQSANS